MADLKGKKPVSVARVAAVTNEIDAAIAQSRATRTVPQILAEQAKDAAKATVSPAVIAAAANHGQQAAIDKDDKAEADGRITSALAMEIAERFKENTAFNRFTGEIVVWKEEDAVKAKTLLDFIEANVPADTRARMPWPKTEEKDLPAGSNQLHDVIMVRDHNGKLVSSTFYRELAKGTVQGAAYQKTIVDGEATAKSDTKVEGDVARAKRALTTLTNAMASAGKLCIQWDRAQLLTGLDIYWDVDDKGKVRRVPQPIIIQGKGANRAQRNKVAIPVFCNYRIDAKLMKDKPELVTFNMLKNTVKARKVVTPTVAKKYEQKSVSEMMAAINEAVSYYRSGDPMAIASRHSELIAHLAKTDRDAWSIVQLFNVIEPLVRANNGAMITKATAYATALDASSKGATGAAPDATPAATTTAA